MPLYDYGCKNEECKHVFEALHKIADTGPSECPKCGSTEVKKIVSAVHGKVELTGNELKAQIKADAQKLKYEATTNEKVRANLVGEGKYQANIVRNEKILKELSEK